MKFLMVGDVMGFPGENALNKFLAKRAEDYDFIIVNGENVDKCYVITPNIAKNMFLNGVDVITLGNHSFDKRDIFSYLDKENRIVRPYNMHEGAPGAGYTIINKNGIKICVISIQGKIYMSNTMECPFKSIDNLLEKIKNKVEIIIIDFHAEVTSEKIAMGWNVAGKVSAIYGTHTHVQTADDKILLGKTAYISDVGMTGGHGGVIGMDKKNVLYRFKTGMPTQLKVCEDDVRINAIEVIIDEKTGYAKKINKINIGYEEI